MVGSNSSMVEDLDIIPMENGSGWFGTDSQKWLKYLDK